MGKPTSRFTVGNVDVVIWENEGEKAGKKWKLKTVTVQKIYSDKQGKMKYTDSLGVNEIPKARLALLQAYAYLLTGKEEIKKE